MKARLRAGSRNNSARITAKSISAREAAQFLPKLAWHCDEPFAVSSGLALYFLAKTRPPGGQGRTDRRWRRRSFRRLYVEAHRLSRLLHIACQNGCTA